jgi:hypothetical protein
MTVRSVGGVVRGARRAGEVGYRAPPYSVSQKCLSVVRFALVGRVFERIPSFKRLGTLAGARQAPPLDNVYADVLKLSSVRVGDYYPCDVVAL